MKINKTPPTRERLLSVLRRMLDGETFYSTGTKSRCIATKEVIAIERLGVLLHSESARLEPIRWTLVREPENIARAKKLLEPIMTPEEKQQWLDDFWSSNGGQKIAAMISKNGYDPKLQSYDTVQKNLKVLTNAIFGDDHSDDLTAADLRTFVSWDVSDSEKALRDECILEIWNYIRVHGGTISRDGSDMRTRHSHEYACFRQSDHGSRWYAVAREWARTELAKKPF